MVKSIQSLDRGLSVLEQLSEAGALSLAELAKQTDLPKATLLRLLKTMGERGWVHRRLNDGKYLATERQRREEPESHNAVDYGRSAGPEMVRLSRATGLPCDLTLLVAPGTLEVVESTRQKQANGVDPMVVGFRPSLIFSSPGRAILSALSRQDRQHHLAHILRMDSPAERFALTSGHLDHELNETRARGYAVRASGYWPDSSDYGEEPMDIALPLFGKNGLAGSLSLVWPLNKAGHEEMAKRHLEHLKSSAQIISG